jgi:hypothetical protein
VTDTRTDIARQLGFVAADLDRRHYPYAGVLRQAARVLLGVDQDTSGCRGCGRPLDQPPTGRRRRWCGERCRRRHRR